VNEQWQLVFDEIPFRFLMSKPAAQRRLLFAAFDSLKGQPYKEPDFQSKDTVGRQLNIRGFRPFLITYWLDASVKEVRVADIERVAS
jgi:hypothetical protein